MKFFAACMKWIWAAYSKNISYVEVHGDAVCRKDREALLYRLSCG